MKNTKDKKKACKHEWFLAEVFKEKWANKEYAVICKFCLEKKII